MKVVIGLCERVSREKSRRETQSQSRSSSTLDQTRGEIAAAPSRSVETGLNATNEALIKPNRVHQGFSDLSRIECVGLIITVLKSVIFHGESCGSVPSEKTTDTDELFVC